MTSALALSSTFQKIAAMFAVVFAFLIVYAAMPMTAQAQAGVNRTSNAQYSGASGVSEAQIQSILQQLQASGASQSLINQIVGVLRGQSGQPSPWSKQNNSNEKGEFSGNNTPAGWQNRQVVFEARPNSGKAPLIVTFGSSVKGEATSGAAYYVNFGDGSTAKALDCVFSRRECTAPGSRSVKHTYTTPGTYTAVLSKVVLCTAPAGAACAQAPAEVVASTTITVASSTSLWNNDNDNENDQNPQSKVRPLWFGRSGDDVREIQACLAKDREIYPAGVISGYYGPLTEEAVKKFQSKHGIVSSGNRTSTGWGMVGPATRALMKGRCGLVAGSYFLAAPSVGTLPLKVKFTSNVGTKIEFGDGASEQFSYCQATTCAQEGFSVEHTYPFAGTYTARALKVEGSGTSTIERTVGSAVIKVASTTPWGRGPASFFPNQNN